MIIRSLSADDPIPMNLLLDADPSVEMVEEYLANGVTVVGEHDGNLIGVYVLLEINPETIEIMNIAVAEEWQGQGIGRQLIEHAIRFAKEKGYHVIRIGTGNSSVGQLALYQKCGFRLVGIETDFFVIHYPEPIFENGIQCRDKIRLEIQLREEGK